MSKKLFSGVFLKFFLSLYLLNFSAAVTIFLCASKGFTRVVSFILFSYEKMAAIFGVDGNSLAARS